jgi:adenylate cyclase
MTTEDVTVLTVDDQPTNLRLLEAVLSPRGYRVIPVGSGSEALERLQVGDIDLVLLDLVMPGLDGFEVCRRIRTAAKTAFLPVVVITASGEREKRQALEVGADDFLNKPFDQAELLARVASLVRIKRYHDTVTQQAAELARWNAELETRVERQVDELQRVNRLRRFLSPQVAELVVNAGDDAVLSSHRREIVVVFCDLRGFTAFAESSEPEEVMAMLAEYHAALGQLIFRYGGTLERFTGDGLMVFFNDPIPIKEPARRAVEMSMAMRDTVRSLADGWRRLGHDLGFGVGIAQGYATLGRIGYENRFDYAAIGSVTNLAARLCAEATSDQVLVSQRALAAIEHIVQGKHLGALELRGFRRPIPAFDVTAIVDQAPEVVS